ncbi:MAG: glutathione S-transferase family protein [Lysobacteraceae bacterium]|nr:MAG: glutathione S-transferase family protein [Xanthomonadaceae bacterium]
MKLYYSPGACSMTDHIVLEWIGAPYEAIAISREDRRTPAYLAINPAGAVPALVEDDGWVLTQNSAILHYLSAKHPEAKLFGDGTPRAAAEVDRWLAFVNADVHPSFWPYFGGLGWLQDEASLQQGKAAAGTKLRGLFERADRQLQGRDWIAGTRSAADPYLFVVTRWAKAVGVDLSGLDALERHHQRMLADEAVQRVMKAEGL